jgi:hypothetical protein
MNLKQQLHRGWLIVLKHTLNPLTRRIARSQLDLSRLSDTLEGTVAKYMRHRSSWLL